MADYTLPLQDHIHETSEIAIKYRTLSCQFGDGYESVAADGINTTVKTWSVQLRNLGTTDYTTAMNFFNTVQSNKSFYATPKNESQQTWRLVPDTLKIQHIAESNITGDAIKTVSFTLKKVYE